MKFAACALALSLAIPAVAGAGVPTAAVQFRDLDLNSTAGAKVMLRRLDRAALSVCGASEFSVREYQRDVRRSDCYDQAMQSAVRELGAPSVSAAYSGAMNVASR